MQITELIRVLSSKPFDTHNEKQTQAQIGKEFQTQGIRFEREFRLTPQDIPDFFIDGIAIEVKIKWSARAIFKQCERYCQSDKVTALILVTNKSIGFPKEINGKPCYVVKLGKQWL